MFIRYHIDETGAKVLTRCSPVSDPEKLPNSALIIRRFPEQGTSQTPIDDRRCLHFDDVYIFNHSSSAEGYLQEYSKGRCRDCALQPRAHRCFGSESAGGKTGKLLLYA
jgi:hypothetical protein